MVHLNCLHFYFTPKVHWSKYKILDYYCVRICALLNEYMDSYICAKDGTNHANEKQNFVIWANGFFLGGG